MNRPLTVVQLLPELDVGGVERGTLEIAAALVAAGHRALVVSGGGRLVAELEASGAEHLHLPIGNKRLSSVRYVAALTELYRRHQVDIVHARSRLPAWLGWLARRRLAPAVAPRWVTTVHGPYSVNRYSRIMTSGERVIAISEFIRDYIVRNYPQVRGEAITVIPRGVDRARYQHGFRPDPAWLERWAHEQPQLAGQTLLTLPARLTRWKGQLDFIEMLAELRRRGHAVHGVLVGAAHPRKTAFERELRAAARARGLDRAITFLGSRSDLREILALSTLAYSLTGEPEAFGRTTIEALSLGIPVIGYDHGGTAEILSTVFRPGLVPVGDVMAAVERSEKILAEGATVPLQHPYTCAAMQAATLGVYRELSHERD